MRNRLHIRQRLKIYFRMRARIRQKGNPHSLYLNYSSQTVTTMIGLIEGIFSQHFLIKKI